MNEIIKSIGAKSLVGIPILKGDYLKDGIYYCGKCHTPKRKMIEFQGTTREVGVLCSCGQAEYDREQEEIHRAKREMYIDHLRKLGIQDSKLLTCSFNKDDSPDSKCSTVLKRYVDKWSEISKNNIGLLLYGEVGTGKSFYAGCIANELINRYAVPVVVTSIPRILNRLFSINDKNSYIETLTNAALLVIDDLGAERDTDYSMEQVFTVIDERYKANKPLIVTTNLKREQLKNPKDIRLQRIYDRILEMCTPIEINGESRRKTSAGFKKNEAKRILFD